jgi:histidine triad (HIT) family protein
MVDECIFCKIVRREIPAFIVQEDEDSVVFLDINPRSKGMCIVVPKQHFETFEQNRELASKLFDKALIVAEKIQKSLNPITVFMSVMQAQVPHFNIRVYPVYKDQIPLIENKPIETTEEELIDTARRISSFPVEWSGRKEVKVIEKPREEMKEKPNIERSEEDKFWVKRHMDMA